MRSPPQLVPLLPHPGLPSDVGHEDGVAVAEELSAPSGCSPPPSLLSPLPLPLPVPLAQGRGGSGVVGGRRKKEAGKEGPRQPEQGEREAGPGVLGQDGCGDRIRAAGAPGWAVSRPFFSQAPLSPALRSPPPTTHTSRLLPPSSTPTHPPLPPFPLILGPEGCQSV